MRITRRERLRQKLGLTAPITVVDIAHRRLNVGVPHPRLHGRNLGATHSERSEGVAQVMKAQVAHTSPLQRRLVTGPQGTGIQETSELSGEHQVLPRR